MPSGEVVGIGPKILVETRSSFENYFSTIFAILFSVVTSNLCKLGNNNDYQKHCFSIFFPKPVEPNVSHFLKGRDKDDDATAPLLRSRRKQNKYQMSFFSKSKDSKVHLSPILSEHANAHKGVRNIRKKKEVGKCHTTLNPILSKSKKRNFSNTLNLGKTPFEFFTWHCVSSLKSNN